MEIATVGLDLAKSVFQVHAVDATGAVIVRKALRRSQMLPFHEAIAVPSQPINVRDCCFELLPGMAAIGEAPRTIRIAAALIDDDTGCLLLVRKVGTKWFMQAGGKIEDGESPVSALCRELDEEIGLALADDNVRHIGCYSAPAANEPGTSSRPKYSMCGCGVILPRGRRSRRPSG